MTFDLCNKISFNYCLLESVYPAVRDNFIGIYFLLHCIKEHYFTSKLNDF